MKPIKLLLVVALLCTVLAAGYPAYQAKTDRTEVALQAAIKKEMVDGDLKAAIEQYKKIIATRGASRAVVAKAMLHLGGCYEKQGNAEARNTFEQVLDDYSDQTDVAAEARTRLANLTSRSGDQAGGGGVRIRQVWAGLGSQGPPETVSPDGRSAAHITSKNDLVIRDLTTGSERRLASLAERGDMAYSPRWSPDGNWIAYIWSPAKGKDEEIRLYDLSVNTSRVLFVDDSLWEIHWSRYPKQLLATRGSTSFSLGVVSVETAQFREIKRLEPPRPSFWDLSPDGKYVAYAASIRQNPINNDLIVIDAATGNESCHIEHPADESLLGWTPDGRYLLFQSDRTGSPDLWAQRIDNGKAVSEAVPIKSFGEWIRPMGFTAGGTLLYDVSTAGSDLYLTNIDPASGRASEPQKIIRNHEGSNYGCTFSPDGHNLAYSSFRGILSPSLPKGTTDTICLYSLETGTQREYTMRFRILYWTLCWSSDGRYLGFTGYDVRERKSSLYKLEIKSGNVIKVLETIPGSSALLSSNGKVAFLSYLDPGGDKRVHLIRRDLQTGEDRQLFPELPLAPWQVSPDGKYVGFSLVDRTQEKKPKFSIGIASIEDGTQRILLTREDMSLSANRWTPDGRSLILLARAAPISSALWDIWLLPIEGGAPKKLGLSKMVVSVTAHPDGKRIAFTSNTGNTRQVWAIDNPLSPVKDTKQSK